MSKSETSVSTAQAFLTGLIGRGIEYIFVNAGTDFPPIIEALLEAQEQGIKVPKFITVPHENVAISMAQGYYRISGKIAAVMVHVSVGTANTVCGMMNAARDNIPLLLAAGRTPNTEIGHIASRSGGIHWGQENFDQGGMLREFVKWDYELRAGQPAETVIGRALDIAMSEPRGPVYLTLPREVLADEAGSGTAFVPERALGAVPALPDPGAVEEAANLIANAANPLLVTSTSGRHPDSVNQLARLADDFAIRVVTHMARDLNLPSDHPMNLGSLPHAYVRDADLVIVVDCEVPWIPKHGAPPPDAKIIHISSDPFFTDLPLRGHRVDLAIAGSSIHALPTLHDALSKACKGKKALINTRRKTAGAQRAALNARRAETLEQARSMQPIHNAWLCHCLNQVKKDDTILINELGVQPDIMDLSLPGTLMSNSPAAGLGFGLGASLGAKLAAPKRDVIAIMGDGSYMFANPTPAHFVARAEGLPVLTIVNNNAMWNAVRASTIGMYPDGRTAKSNRLAMADLSPSPEFHQIMEACGGQGEKVEDPADLEAALRRGLEAVRAGRSALVNVIARPGR